MTFKIVYEPRAKSEFIEIGNDYSITEELTKWVRHLADEAEAGIDTDSLNVAEAIDDLIQQGVTLIGDIEKKNSWSISWERVKKAPLADKIKALWIVIRRRRAPWEFRMAVHGFYLLECIPHDVVTWFEIDRTIGQVRFIKFELGEPLASGKY